MMSSNLPAVVVGAGAVGLACATELARRGWWVLLLEKAHAYGTGASSRNSEVIHSGIYYEPGSLKARLCVEGRERLYRYLNRCDLPRRRCEKLIVATAPEEVSKLEALRKRALENGIDPEALDLIDADRVRALEPGVRAVAALRSRVTGILDAHSFMDALAADLQQEGGDLALRAELLAADLEDGTWQLRIRDASGAVDEFRAAVVVNAAGLHSDEVARRAAPLADSDLPRQQWVKGNYFAIRAASAVHASRLIYPCPRSDLRGLGVHLTVDLAGGQRLGPDVEVLENRVETYTVAQDRRDAFAEGARPFLPDLEPDDLAPAFAGLRPQRVVEQGFRDFYIAHEEERGAPGWVNLIGIESPGLTCSLAIGREVADFLEQ